MKRAEITVVRAAHGVIEVLLIGHTVEPVILPITLAIPHILFSPKPFPINIVKLTLLLTVCQVQIQVLIQKRRLETVAVTVLQVIFLTSKRPQLIVIHTVKPIIVPCILAVPASLHRILQVIKQIRAFTKRSLMLFLILETTIINRNPATVTDTISLHVYQML